MAHEHFKSCIDACNGCAVACDRCASACLKEQDVEKMARCVQLDNRLRGDLSVGSRLYGARQRARGRHMRAMRDDL